jgi:hypothetical protein
MKSSTMARNGRLGQSGNECGVLVSIASQYPRLLRWASSLLCLAVIVWAPSSVEAACSGSSPNLTVSAATQTGIEECHTAAATGDTINLIAGTYAITSTVAITKAVTIVGPTCTADGNDRATSCTAIIEDQGSASYVMSITLVANQITRLSNITFRATATSAASYYLQLSGSNTDNRRLRLDHLVFSCNTECNETPSNAPATIFQTSILGVLDHSSITASNPAWVAQNTGSTWDGGAYGDKSWIAADDLGSAKFFFIENNNLTFSNSTVSGAITMVDCHSGGRYVVRYNTITLGVLDGHGHEAGRNRGCRAWEVYNNILTGDGTSSNVLFLRGGVGVAYDNGIYNYGATPQLTLQNYRSADYLTFSGGADGRSEWDVNDGSNPFETGTCDAVGTLTCTDNGRAFANYAGYQIRRTSGVACTDLSRSGSTVTATCAGHGFSNGQIIGVFGATPSTWNGVYSITNATMDTFDYTISYTPGAESGTIRAVVGNWFSEITSNTGTVITFKDSIYGATRRLAFTAGDTFEIMKVTHSMDGIGRSGGSEVSGDVVTLPAGWNDQTTSKVYEWDNLKCPSSPPTVGCASGTDVDWGTVSGTFVENTHFVNDTEAPGYSPYTYPHPLVTCGQITCNSGGAPGRLHLRRASIGDAGILAFAVMVVMLRRRQGAR